MEKANTAGLGGQFVIDIVVLGLLGGILAVQGYLYYRFSTVSSKLVSDVELVHDAADDIEANLNSLAPILQAIIERIDGGMELMERAPESPLAPLIQQAGAIFLQRFIDNPTPAREPTWPDAEQRNELPAGSPE